MEFTVRENVLVSVVSGSDVYLGIASGNYGDGFEGTWVNVNKKHETPSEKKIIGGHFVIFDDQLPDKDLIDIIKSYFTGLQA